MNKRFCILVVDDDPINVQTLVGALENKYDCLSALDGHDAISQLKNHKVDLIFLDVMMPGLSGYDVCQIIKSDKLLADIPVVFITALDTDEGSLRGLELGAIDYLTKPVNLDLLKLRVRNHLALKEQRDLLAEQKEKLEVALAQVKQLEGIIPICSYCNKIRDDQNSWHQLEAYISNHSEALFSHGICPTCVKEQIEKIKNM
jgi:DNA-binding response OmpR family regulator